MNDCQHWDFEITRKERVGYCTCRICGQEILLGRALNNMIDRVQWIMLAFLGGLSLLVIVSVLLLVLG